MDGWRLFGRAILAGVDALGAGLVGGVLAFLVLPWYAVGVRLEVAMTVGGTLVGVTLAISLALVGLGRRPFPATRLARAGLVCLPLWWP